MELIGLFLYVISSYFLIRLFWIKRFQSVVLMRSPPIFMSMPRLRYMLWYKFWVWDEAMFLPENIDPTDLRSE